jgi:hypothetical protein
VSKRRIWLHGFHLNTAAASKVRLQTSFYEPSWSVHWFNVVWECETGVPLLSRQAFLTTKIMHSVLVRWQHGPRTRKHLYCDRCVEFRYRSSVKIKLCKGAWRRNCNFVCVWLYCVGVRSFRADSSLLTRTKIQISFITQNNFISNTGRVRPL